MAWQAEQAVMTPKQVADLKRNHQSEIGKKGGLRSGEVRRNNRPWVPHATELLREIYDKTPELASEPMAVEAIFRWKEIVKEPGLNTMKKFIVELRDKGHLPPKKSGN
jgi:hypothetical protein